MTTVKIRLNTARADRTGCYPLVLQILHLRCKRIVSTPYRLRQEQFDPVKERVLPVRGTLSEIALIDEIDAYLTSEKQKLNDIVSAREKRGDAFSAGDIVQAYAGSGDNRELLTFLRNTVNELMCSNRESSGYTYKSTLSMLVRFGCSERMPVADITSDFLNGFMRFMLDEGLTPNSAALYMRILRAVYNRAVDMGIAGDGRDPFRRIRIRNEKTDKRAVHPDILRRLEEMDLSENSSLQIARDLFLFSFYARGMSFVDMVFLKRSDIRNGFVVYRRRKTNQRLCIRISGRMQNLMDRYRTVSQYVFPVLDRECAPSVYTRYKTALRKHNMRLKRIGMLLKLESGLTSYVARHSWATIAKRMGIPISVISEGLGHTSEKTTAIYLDSFEDDVVDRANEMVTALVAGKTRRGRKLYCI